MSREPQIMKLFVSTLYERNLPIYENFEISPIYQPGDVIDDMTSWVRDT